MPGGTADGVAYPRSEADVAAILREQTRVLVVGAQSSLTGGATPTGGVVLSTSRLTALALSAPDRVTVGPGVTLAALDARLVERDAWYPPAPTYAGATVGGTVATNAAGAATFKYGPARPWVEALTIVLPGGEVLDLARGAVRAPVGGAFEIQTRQDVYRIDVPAWRWPAVPKVSAGFFTPVHHDRGRAGEVPGEPLRGEDEPMDLIDLFIGAEGTLGVVTSATLRILPRRPLVALALVLCSSRAAGLQLVAELRDESRATWRTRASGLDVSAIEHMDARCLALLREDGVDRRCGITLPPDVSLALLVTLELPPGSTSVAGYAEIGGALEPNAPDTPLVRFCRRLAAHDLLDVTDIALPGDRRQAALLAFREAVPAAVNQRIAHAQRAHHPRIEKVAADVIVPFDQLGALLDACDTEFSGRGLDGAVWGHISDGNLHPNVIPASERDLDEGKAAMLALGRTAMRLGGAPCAEHGVGRNPIKLQLMREMVGEAGFDAMRRIKRTLDPRGVLAPGVLGL